jgi:hypothetical protein
MHLVGSRRCRLPQWLRIDSGTAWSLFVDS